MKTRMLYYTGTGNSLWTARLLAQRLGDVDLQPMHGADPRTAAREVEAFGLVFPVHIWGVPVPVVRFLEKLEAKPGLYSFAVAVNAGAVSRTLLQLRTLLARRGVKLAAGFDVVLPSNYIPWGGPGPKERQMQRIEKARKKIEEAAETVAGRKVGRIDRGPLWQRIFFTGIYKMTCRYVHKMDRDFWCDDKCNSCGICAGVCPAQNIALETGRPVWQHRCEQCLACLQWCPQEAIQYGKKTPRYERYHHPEIALKDMLP